jgi:hypothetical protein
MTEGKDFKHRVRARMDKTGESYTTARAQLLGTTNPTPSPAAERSSEGGHRFPIRQSRWFAALNRRLAATRELGMEDAAVAVTADTITVAMGELFHLVAPLSTVASAEPYRGRVTGWGVHETDGVWLVNGSRKGIVAVTFDPAATARAKFGSVESDVSVREVRVSVGNPAELIRRLRPPSE